jgi:hypothetical protein
MTAMLGKAVDLLLVQNIAAMLPLQVPACILPCLSGPGLTLLLQAVSTSSLCRAKAAHL